jgi:hypothetical protein
VPRSPLPLPLPNEHHQVNVARTRVIRRRLTPTDRVETPYLSIPFEITRGTPSVEVLLSYDQHAGVIDLGCEGAGGWRGWSGGARTRFVITPQNATWGYLPGELEHGTWNVVLGLHKVPAAGLKVEVTINTPAQGAVQVEPDAPAPRTPEPASAVRALPALDGLHWFAGDFHAHTLHSDGALSIRQLAARAVNPGLDFLAVTDHNTTSHHAHLPGVSAEYGVTLLPGQEVTTARGHANAFGRIPWVDFRKHPQSWVDAVDAAGGILSINHPIGDDCSWQWSLEREPSHAEIMHSSWQGDLTSTGPFAWWNAWGTDRAAPLGGSDFHAPEQGIEVGTPTTWVAAEDSSVDAILAGVKAGRTALSMAGTRSGAVLLRLGDEMVALDADGAVFSDFEGRRRMIVGNRVSIPAPAGEGPYRLESADREILAVVA